MSKALNKNILITGGTGFIGSHTYVSLLGAGYNPIILDNLSNSSISVIRRLDAISGLEPLFIQGDIRNRTLLDKLFSEHPISAVIHFAGLKAVGESVKKPLEYYDNNVKGTLELLAAMRQADCKTLIFSSSATVYGDPSQNPILENFPCSVTNPYGRTKLIIEEMLEDIYRAESDWNIARLRYFNPIGAHESGLIGENPEGIPNNLMPYLTQVAVGNRECLNIFGGDYPTPDGTGIRDYIHVMDLAEGHVSALEYFQSNKGLLTANLGTGFGVSVLEMVKSFEQATGKKINYKIVDRRGGDVSEIWADVTLAKQTMDWTAQRTLQQMCIDAWRWQVNNPDGFES